MGRDVTGERLMEAEREKLLATLRESNRQLTEANRTCAAMAQTAERRLAERQSVLDNMADAVLVADTDGRIIMANEAAAGMFGLDRPEDPRTSIDGLNESHMVRMADGQPRPKHTHPLARALSGETVTLEDSIIRNPKTGKDVYLRSNAAPMRDERGRIVGAVSVGRDVTELTELERLKEELISVTAHELKTPVTIMKGFAQTLLLKADDLSPERRKILDYIDRGANRIDSVVQEMLDISLLTNGGFASPEREFDLTEFVEQMVDRMALSNPGHQLRLTRADRVSVHADMRRLAQVLDNLLDNAIRYSPAGGLVQVEVKAERDRAEVAVSDHGIGIPSAKQARIFQRLYRAHTGTPYDYGGMGVGLYLAREIIRCHGGDMDFESVEGVGSTFRFSLPVGESDSHASPGVPPQ